MFGKIFSKVLLPVAKKMVEKEIQKKTGTPVKIDDIVGVAKKIL